MYKIEHYIPLDITENQVILVSQYNGLKQIVLASYTKVPVVGKFIGRNRVGVWHIKRKMI